MRPLFLPTISSPRANLSKLHESPCALLTTGCKVKLNVLEVGTLLNAVLIVCEIISLPAFVPLIDGKVILGPRAPFDSKAPGAVLFSTVVLTDCGVLTSK